MQVEDIKALLAAQFAGDDIEVVGADGKYQLHIVSDQFEGLTPVKKQQAVYAVLNDHIKSGAIHAVSMQLFTKAQWQAKNG